MRTYRMLAALSTAVLMGLAGAGTAAAQEHAMDLPEGRVMKPSQNDFDRTVSRIDQAIGQENMMVVARVDHRAMLSMVDVEAGGMLTFEFFHPRYGKTIFENNRTAGIEIPLRIVVMEGPNGTMLTYNRPSHIFGGYDGLEELGRDLDAVLERIIAHAASEG